MHEGRTEIDVYDRMAKQFGSQGLNLQSLAHVRQLFQTKHGVLSPADFPGHPASVSPDTERFLVVPVAAACSEIQQVAHSLIQAVQSSLPEDTEHFANDPHRLHVTVFYTSRLGDARPHPAQPLNAELQAMPSDSRPAPSEEEVQLEQQTAQAVVAQCRSIHFEVHRVVMADSGTLMICLLDTQGRLSDLRHKLHVAFPGCPDRQTTTAHVSGLRLFSTRQLSAAEKQQLQAVCHQYTQRLKGLKFVTTDLWFVHKTPVMFNANVEGQAIVMKLC